MNKIIKHTVILVAMALCVASCGKDFLTYKNSSTLDTDDAITTPKGARNAVIGTYETFASYPFFGRNAQATIDFLGDMTSFRGGTNAGHLNLFENYTFHDASAEIGDLWLAGYRVIDRATRMIKESKNVVLKDPLIERVPDASMLDLSLSLIGKAEVYFDMSQAYGMKALSTFYMTNLFGQPYTYEKTSPGIVVVGEEPMAVGQNISRATVEQCYTQILSDIDSAITYFGEAYTLTASGVPADYIGYAWYPTTDQFVMNIAAIYALQARVYLYMGDWQSAVTAAEGALYYANGFFGSASVSNENYVSMWASTEASIEDIFTVNYQANTSLSANSMNNLYRSYGGAVTLKNYNLFATTDIRRNMFMGKQNSSTSLYSRKYPNSSALNNNPIFRISEMYLIIAEGEAQSNNIDLARTALLYVAKRNTAITSIAALPTDQDDLLAFIADERCRELYQEGHRWFDLRRRGDLMSRVDNQTLRNITNFDVKKLALPIPQGEINVSKLVQNDWIANMPG